MMADRRLPHPRPAPVILVCAALLAFPVSVLMRNEVKRVKSEGRGEIILIDQRSGLGTPSYALRSDGQGFDFQTDISTVHVDLPRPKSGPEGGGAARKEVAPAKPGPTPADAGAPIVTQPPASGTPPVADSAAARACVRLETVPTMLTPGCTKSVYARNSCDRPVVALVKLTQHLMSGALSDMASVQVPPRGESWVACAWWSGAMAPAVHDLIGAGFVEPPQHHGPGDHHGDRQGP